MKIRINEDVTLASGEVSAVSGFIVSRIRIDIERKAIIADYLAWPSVQAYQNKFRGQPYVSVEGDELENIVAPIPQADIDAANNDSDFSVIGNNIPIYIRDWLIANLGVSQANLQMIETF